MTCIIKIQLKADAPIKKILEVFKINPAKERAYLLKEDESLWSLKNVLCIPYGELGEDPRIVMDYIIFKIAERYGVREVYHANEKEYSCYYSNNTCTFLLSNKEIEDLREDGDLYPKVYGILSKNGEITKLKLQEAIDLKNTIETPDYLWFVETHSLEPFDHDNEKLKESVAFADDRADFILESIGLNI